MKLSPSVTFLLGLIFASTLTGCGDVRLISHEQAEVEDKMTALRAEDLDLQQKLMTLKQVVPPNINSTLAATNMAIKNQGDNQQIGRELAKAVKSYEETEASLRALEKEIEELRKLPKP